MGIEKLRPLQVISSSVRVVESTLILVACAATVAFERLLERAVAKTASAILFLVIGWPLIAPVGKLLQPIRDLLRNFFQELDQILHDATLICNESEGSPFVAATSGSADPVNVIVDVRGHIVVEHKWHIGEVKSSCSNISGY